MERLKLSSLLITLACLIVVMALSARDLFAARPVSGETLSTKEYLWYYLPHSKDEQPKPMEKAPYIEEYDVIYVGDAESKMIYLTFDDSPNKTTYQEYSTYLRHRM